MGCTTERNVSLFQQQVNLEIKKKGKDIEAIIGRRKQILSGLNWRNKDFTCQEGGSKIEKRNLKKYITEADILEHETENQRRSD